MKIKIHRSIILPVVLYIREESRLRVFEKTVLREIFGPKRNEVPGE